MNGFHAALLLFFILPPLTSAVKAGETDDFRFASRLQRDGMYIAAAEEYIRFSEKYPGSVLRPDALFNAGESWMKAGKASEALDVFETMLTSYSGHKDACKARYYRGDIFKVLKRYRESADEFLMIDEVYPDCPLVGQALLSAGESILMAGEPHEAASVLRRLTDSKDFPGLQPRALYNLAASLQEIGRDLEAASVLERLTSEYSKSPVAALAFMRLGEDAFARGEYPAAGNFFKEAAGRYKEDILREKAVLRILDVTGAEGNIPSFLRESEHFLNDFPDSPSRPDVYRKAIESAWELGETKKALTLIDRWRGEGTGQDSTGAVSLLRGKILASRAEKGKALEELREFRHRWSSSPLLVEALRLEAKLLIEDGRGEEAEARLQLALIEDARRAEHGSILNQLASLAIEGSGDTLSALRYWDMVIALEDGLETHEEALWRSASTLDGIGDATRALDRFDQLLSVFPDGRYSGEAKERMAILRLRDRKSGDPISDLARIAAGSASITERYVDVGIILLDKADRPEHAFAFFDRLKETDLPDSLWMKVAYYKGKSKKRIYEKSLLAGKEEKRLLGDAVGFWSKVASRAPGTYWGGLSHRAYLENRLGDWNLEDQIKRLDEFTGYYRSGENMWWAVSTKADLLYDRARSGEGWAVDSSLVVFSSILQGDPPASFRKEALLKTGYLLRMKGQQEAAARALTSFVDENSGDERTAPVLYDLGELFLSMREYKKALDSYSRSLDSPSPGPIRSKCQLRIGDCLYYLQDFTGAKEAYSFLGSLYPESPLADEAAYRESITLQRLGEYDRSDSILVSLSTDENLSKSLRARVLSRLGENLLAGGKAEEARVLIEELVKIERKGINQVLYGEVLYETGDYAGSIKAFSDAIRFEGIDTCRVLTGMASARFRDGNIKEGSRDLQRLLEYSPGCEGISAVMLEKGKMEAANGHCDKAGETLELLRSRFPGTGPAAEALYHIAVCDLKRGGNAEAIDKLNLFLRESPNTPILDKAYFKLASAHYQSENLNLAAQNYSLAAEASRDDAFVFMALKNMAMINQELEEWGKAGEAWYMLCERFPGHKDIVELFFNLGFCYSQSGRFELAREVYVRIPGIAANEEQRGRAHYWAGISLKNLDRCEEAVREFLRVPYLRTGGMWGITSKLEAAICYERLGQTEQAVQIYERIVNAHGENSDWGSIARKALDRINGVEKKDEAGD